MEKDIKNFYCCSCLSPKHSALENIESRTPYLAIVFLLHCHGSKFYEPILLLNGSFLLLCNFLLRSLRFALLACVNESASATSRKVPKTSMMGNLLCFHAWAAIEAFEIDVKNFFALKQADCWFPADMMLVNSASEFSFAFQSVLSAAPFSDTSTAV